MITEVGSLIKLGPSDAIYYADEYGSNTVHLTDFEYGIVTKVYNNRPEVEECEVLIGNQVFSVLYKSRDVNNERVMNYDEKN